MANTHDSALALNLMVIGETCDYLCSEFDDLEQPIELPISVEEFAHLVLAPDEAGDDTTQRVRPVLDRAIEQIPDEVLSNAKEMCTDGPEILEPRLGNLMAGLGDHDLANLRSSANTYTPFLGAARLNLSAQLSSDELLNVALFVAVTKEDPRTQDLLAHARETYQTMLRTTYTGDQAVVLNLLLVVQFVEVAKVHVEFQGLAEAFAGAIGDVSAHLFSDSELSDEQRSRIQESVQNAYSSLPPVVEQTIEASYSDGIETMAEYFEELFERLNDSELSVIRDTASSYRPQTGGSRVDLTTLLTLNDLKTVVTCIAAAPELDQNKKLLEVAANLYGTFQEAVEE